MVSICGRYEEPAERKEVAHRWVLGCLERGMVRKWMDSRRIYGVVGEMS